MEKDQIPFLSAVQLAGLIQEGGRRLAPKTGTFEFAGPSIKRRMIRQGRIMYGYYVSDLNRSSNEDVRTLSTIPVRIRKQDRLE